MEFVPKQFKFSVLLPNNYYYAALDERDFSAIRTGFIDKNFTRKVPLICYRNRHSLTYNAKNADLVINKFKEVLSDAGTYLFNLDEDTVRNLQKLYSAEVRANKMKSEILRDQYYAELEKARKEALDKNLKKQRTVKREKTPRLDCDVIFKPLINDKLLIEFDINHNTSSLGKSGSVYPEFILNNKSCKQGFRLSGKYLKYLPTTEVEVRLGKNGLISFSSTTLEYDVHFIENIPEIFYTQLFEDIRRD